MSNDSILIEILAVIAFSTLFSLGGGNGQLAIIQDLGRPRLMAGALRMGLRRKFCPWTEV